MEKKNKVEEKRISRSYFRVVTGGLPNENREHEREIQEKIEKRSPNDLFFKIKVPHGLDDIEKTNFIRQKREDIIEKNIEKLRNGSDLYLDFIDGKNNNEE